MLKDITLYGAERYQPHAILHNINFALSIKVIYDDDNAERYNIV